jgi:hypothetical protein
MFTDIFSSDVNVVRVNQQMLASRGRSIESKLCPLFLYQRSSSMDFSIVKEQVEDGEQLPDENFPLRAMVNAQHSSCRGYIR